MHKVPLLSVIGKVRVEGQKMMCPMMAFRLLMTVTTPLNPPDKGKW